MLSPIPVDTKISQANAKRKTIFEHAPTSRAADAYQRLAEWVDARHSTSVGKVTAHG